MGPVTVTISKQVWIQKWERRPQCRVNSSIPMKVKIVCVWGQVVGKVCVLRDDHM